MPDTLFLSDEDLAAMGFDTQDVITALEDTLNKNAAGTLWTAPKSAVVPGDGRYMMSTLSAADNPGVMVVKAVTVSPENSKRGLDTINGAIMVFDSTTGLLRCVMGANWVTGIRTAGLSAVVAKRLANPQSKVIAFVGCGVQARSHLTAFKDMFPLTDLRASGRGQANLDALCDMGRGMGMTATACATPQEALEGADIVVTSITATFDGAPFLDANWLKPGAFAAVTDLGKPWMQDRLSALSTVVIDDREQELSSPQRMVPYDLVTADLAEVIGGKVPVRFDPDRCSAFIFRGMAAGDFAVAAMAYRKAAGQGN